MYHIYNGRYLVLTGNIQISLLKRNTSSREFYFMVVTLKILVSPWLNFFRLQGFSDVISTTSQWTWNCVGVFFLIFTQDCKRWISLILWPEKYWDYFYFYFHISFVYQVCLDWTPWPLNAIFRTYFACLMQYLDS